MDFIKFSKAQIPSKIDDTILHTNKIYLIKNTEESFKIQFFMDMRVKLY